MLDLENSMRQCDCIVAAQLVMTPNILYSQVAVMLLVKRTKSDTSACVKAACTRIAHANI